MRDPNRIDPILARLRAAWIASPDLRLGQLLACSLAIGGAEDKFARLFNAECPEFGAVNAPIEWPPVYRPAPTLAVAPGLDLDAVADTMRGLDNIFAQAMSSRDAEIARLTAERDQAVAHRAATNEEIKRLHAVIKAKGFSVEESIALHETRSEVARLAAELARVTECYSESHAAVGQLTRDIDAGREIDRQNVAEVNRLTAELAAARAVTAGVCRYLDCSASDLLAVVTSLYESRARAISDATAARGTVGGLLATAPECPTWCATHDPRDMATAMDGDRRYASPECRDAGRCLTRGPLPKGG